MAERRNADLFEVLIRQISKDSEIDVILGKTFRVNGHAKLFEPIRNLLHRRPRADFTATTSAESLAILPEKL